MEEKKTFLNIACGNKKIAGFINIDIEAGADIQTDVTKGLPFENSSVHGIFSEHFIEHLPQAEGAAFLRECRRVLVNNGRVRIATPDLDFIVRRYESEDWRKDSGEWIKYGYDWIANRAEQINMAMREWGHQWLYNEEELVRIARVAGLTPLSRCAFGESSEPRLRGLEYREGSRLIYEFVKDRSLPIDEAPLVSVLIPAYNPRYFRKALESALAQSYTNVEIVICDDSPNDHIKDIVAEYAHDQRIRYSKNERNLGSKKNLIKCFELSRGFYIKYLNDDDMLHHDCVTLMVHCLNQFPDVTLVTSHRQCIDHDGKHLEDIRETRRPVASDSLIDGVSLADKMLTTGQNFIGEPSTVMFRKKDLQDTRPNMISFAERECIAIADQTMWVNLLSRGDAIYLVDTLSYFRLHPEQGQRQPSFFPKIVPAIKQLRFDAKRMGFLRGSGAEQLLIRPLEKTKDSNAQRGDAHGEPMISCNQRRLIRQEPHSDSPAKFIAFYLPQFHPTPENDAWWGKGFTEWTNVKKAAPQFPGHYQPHIPADLGYYDLRRPEARQAQADLARMYGIYGFCYYHYWFSGKRLLNLPIDEILASGRPDFPFCLCWANEHWTRAWDGRQGEILMEQKFSEEDDRNHIQWLLKVFQDNRYIRINNKPLMIIYLSTRLPNAARTVKIWREEARKMGEELYLCKVESAPYEYGDPRPMGFDASIEFQPDWGNLGPVKKQLANGHVVFDYPAIIERMIRKPVPPYRRFPCVTPSWDNSPRRKQAAVIIDNSTPSYYAKWLNTIIRNLGKFNLDEQIVFINAWNEWGEGNHLEPDSKFGKAYLEVTKQALSIAGSERQECFHGLVSIIILAYNQLKYTVECVESIGKHTPEPHEIIFVDNGSTDGTVKWLRKFAKENSLCTLIENKENLGFARGCNQGIAAASGEYILLLNNDVVVTPGWLAGLLECINASEDTGIVGPMTNSISGPQKVEHVDYTAINGLDEYAQSFRERNRHRRIPLRRIVGFCILFRRELVEAIGVLDESFGSGNFEDDDYCLRAALLGYRNLIAGDVLIHHYGSRSFIGNRMDYGSAITGNRQIFNGKWGNVDVQSLLGKKILALRALEEARELQQKGRLEDAVKNILAALKHSPDDRQLYITIAEMLIDSGQFKDALDVLNGSSLNDDPQGHALMGYCKEGMGSHDEAWEYADRALSVNPRSAPALNLKGIIAYRREDRKSAKGFFQQALAIDPGYGEPYTNLGVLKWTAAQRDEAIALLEKGVILSPTATDILTIYYSAITELGCFERAEKVLREAHGIYPTGKRIAFLLIDSLIQQGKHDVAMEEIEKAMIVFGIDDGILSAALAVRKRTGPQEIGQPARRKGTLSLCMIVKNEEQNLARCLMSVKPVADEMIVIDTGSSDRTKDIALAFGAKVYDFPWTGDFAGARNCSLSHATGGWILVLDADEVISPLDSAELSRMISRRNTQSAAYSFVTRNYVIPVSTTGWTANDGKYAREEAGTGWFPSVKVRLFPNDRRIGFVNPVHELVEPSLKNAGIPIKACSIPIHHYGKLDEEKDARKGEHYYLLGKKKIEETGENADALRELAIQAGGLKKHDEAIELWQKLLKLEPDSSLAYLNMSSLYLELDRYDNALTTSRKAFELDPARKEAAYNYSLCQLYAGNGMEAIAVLESLTKKEPAYPSARVLLAVAHCCTGNREKGFGLLTELQKMEFGFADSICKFARKLVAAGRPDYAALMLDASIASGNVSADIFSLREECGKVTPVHD